MRLASLMTLPGTAFRYIRHYAECLVDVLSYLKARMAEPSTWASIVAGIAGVSALNPPWDKVAFVCAVIGVLLPSPQKTDQ